MINWCSQLVGSGKEDLFQGPDLNLQQVFTKALSLHFFLSHFCSYSKFYFCRKFLPTLSEVAKKQPESFLSAVFLCEIFEPESFWFHFVSFHFYSKFHSIHYTIKTTQ